jgi:hypothetical protein
MQGTFDPALVASSIQIESSSSSTVHGSEGHDGNAESVEPVNRQFLFPDVWEQRLQLEGMNSLIHSQLYSRQWHEVDASASSLMSALEGAFFHLTVSVASHCGISLASASPLWITPY